jgi:hypothetical protein
VENDSSFSHPSAFTKEEIEVWKAHNRFLENNYEEAQWDQVKEMVKIK